MSTIAVIAGFSESLINFRGPLLSQFMNLGYDVDAIAPQNDSITASQLKSMGINFHNIPLHPTRINIFADFFAFLKLMSTLKKCKPSIIFSYTIKPVIYGSLSARFCGLSNIYSMITGLGYGFEESSPAKKILSLLIKYLYRISLSFNKKVFFQNPDDMQFFISQKIVDKNKCVLVNGSGIDLDHFQHSDSFPQNVTFLLISRLIRAKGLIEYAEAARRLKSKYPEIECQLLGYYYKSPDALKPAMVESWVQEGIINYLGETKDVRPFIQQCSVFVLPSFYREGTPRTVLEAMAMGRPVITTDAPGCRETVRHGENGFLVPVKNVDALTDAMEQFIHNPSLCPRMGKVSRQIAEEKFDVHKVNAVICDAMGISGPA